MLNEQVRNITNRCKGFVKKPAYFGWKLQTGQCRRKALEDGYCKECSDKLSVLRKDIEKEQTYEKMMEEKFGKNWRDKLNA